MFKKHKNSVGMDMAVSVCIQSQWVRNPSEVPAALAHKLVSTTGAAPRAAAASPASAATCWPWLAQMSCTRATLASFHPLNLSAVSAWSARICSITCRSASFDWKDRNRELLENTDGEKKKPQKGRVEKLPGRRKLRTFKVLLSVLMRCSLSLTTWFLQRLMKEALNSLFVDGLRSPIGDRLASFRWMYSFSISSDMSTWFPATTRVRSDQYRC